MSGQIGVTPSADSIAASIRAAKTRGLPPVEKWNPPFCGDIDMRIARDGTWFYDGTPIQRPEIVRLFSTILIVENGKFFLVTPVEKVGLVVEDAPFIAVDFSVSAAGDTQTLVFETNVGDYAPVNVDNPLRFDLNENTGEPTPYIHIRRGLEARIDRKSYYRMVDLCTHHDGWFGVWSARTFFPIMRSEDVGDE